MPRRVSPSLLQKAAMQVLQTLELASSVSNGQLGFRFELSDWFIGETLKTLPPLPEEIDAKTISQLSRDIHRLEYIVQLTKVLMTSASDLLELYARQWKPIGSKLSLGLASLPDELLSHILKFSIHHEQRGAWPVISFSHISRRFRRIILDDRSLWSVLYLDHSTKMGNIETCIRRSGEDNDLHVVVKDNLSTSSRGSAVNAFISACSPVASRWRTLTLSGEWDIDLNYGIGDILDQLLSHRLVLPRLDELRISQSHYDGMADSDDDDDDVAWFSSGDSDLTRDSWAVPNLRILRCTQYIPPESFPFTNITSFELNLILIPVTIELELEELLVFLSSMTNISEIDLKLINHDNAVNNVDQVIAFETIAACPSVTSFLLRLTDVSSPLGVNEALVPFMNALQIPNIQRLTIFIEWHSLTADKISGQLQDIIHTLLPDTATHRRLETLIVGLPIPDSDTWVIGAPKVWEKARSMMLDIPLEKIPQVSVLAVTTCGPVSFSYPLELRGGVSQPCSLRELRLHSCQNLDVGGLQRAVESLKDAGAWDALGRIVVERCELLDYGTAVGVIGTERLCFTRL